MEKGRIKWCAKINIGEWQRMNEVVVVKFMVIQYQNTESHWNRVKTKFKTREGYVVYFYWMRMCKDINSALLNCRYCHNALST